MRAQERQLFEKAKQWLALFARERTAILEEKAIGERTPERLHIAEPGGRANLYAALLRSRTQLDPTRVDIAIVTEALEGLER
jgi:hypothetical protein